MTEELVTTSRNSWDQLQSETDIAYSRFHAYLMTERGKRSIRKLAIQLNLSPSTLANTSSKFAWAERVRDWDNQLDEIEQQEVLDERRRIAREAARTAQSALNAAPIAIQAAIRGLRAYADPESDRVLGARESLRALQVGVLAARGAHALVSDRTSKVELSGPGGGSVQIEGLGVGMSGRDLAELLISLTDGGDNDEGRGDVIDVEPEADDDVSDLDTSW